MVALMAKAGALSGAYSFNDDSSFLIDCFSRLANCLESLHGVSPEMSAMAGIGAAPKMMEESARAAEKVCIAEAVDIFSGFGVAEHTVTMVLGFRAKGELSLGFNMDFEKFVGIDCDEE
ncbi:hypothetical protein T11_4932 [Trichinella zimbabwensis]|uniref:Uncharacterized protein n=1 Tax=Trichinella zimbabwensis TaxID=268475 RepID=A0A0V1GIE5_9BILA|nr:hypothetical protein T11_4932 [Trichinella zimbabwensis]